MPVDRMRVSLGGAAVDLMTRRTAIKSIVGASARSSSPLGVASANLDHIFHFGDGGRWQGILDESRGVEWMTLLDGQPLVRASARLTGRRWPRLAGSDLIEELFTEAEAQGVVVGFLGGSVESHRMLRARIASDWPQLRVGGCWAPGRRELVDATSSEALAHEIRSCQVQMLFVGLGKPRQEVWIAEHGPATGAGTLLAFGASADFVAGIARRAPRAVSDVGAEWLWRLGHEPRRLARRYLVEGPGAYVSLRAGSSVEPGGNRLTAHAPEEPIDEDPRVGGPSSQPRLNVVIVTYNSADHVLPLLRDLAAQEGAPPLRTLVVDNCSTDETRDIVADSGLAELVSSASNLGYGGAINLALRLVPPDEPVLVLNPDLRLAPDTVAIMTRRMLRERAGVVVPTIVDERGVRYPSLRFEPTLLRDLGDALFGSALAARPPWATETDFDEESYDWAHTSDWATGAALLVSAEAVAAVGSWSEEFFLYSEETDFMRRVREAGFTVWFEPLARVVHEGGASGSSPDLDALRAVNRVRYAELHHGRLYSSAARAVVALSALVRVPRSEGHRRALQYLLRRGRWSELPSAGAASTDPMSRPAA